MKDIHCRGPAEVLILCFCISTMICGAVTAAFNPRLIGRVIEGNDVLSSEYAFMASLMVKREVGSKVKISYCGGTIVSQNVILTAAHCVDGNVNKVIAHVGHFQKNLGKLYEVHAVNIIVHGKYKRPSYKYDIAVLRPLPKISFDGNTKPIALPKSGKVNYNDQKSYLVGWGQYDLKNLKSTSDILKLATMTVEDHTEENGYCSKDLVCAEPTLNVQADGKGDSGGPLFYYNILNKCTGCLGKPEIIGILSHSLNGLSVFTRVSHYTAWIEANSKKLLQHSKFIIDFFDH